MKVYVDMTYTIVVDIDDNTYDEPLPAAAADDQDFTEFLCGPLECVEFRDYEIITDPDTIRALENTNERPWKLSVTP